MILKTVKRPWEAKRSSYTPDPYYQTQGWRDLRQQHRQGYTMVNGFRLSHVFCIQCYRESKMLVLGATADHVLARKDGGTDTLDNIQTLCSSCDGRKRAIERQMRNQTK